MITSALAVLENDEQRDELSRFYVRYKDRLLSIALSKVHNIEDAEDVLQDSFLAVVKTPDKFFSLSEEERKKFFDGIVSHRSTKKYLDSRKKEKNTESIDEYEIASPISLEDELFSKISVDEIMKFIDELPPLQRMVLYLTRLVGLTIEETANYLNTTKSVVNQRLYLARKSIRQFIAEGDNDE